MIPTPKNLIQIQKSKIISINITTENKMKKLAIVILTLMVICESSFSQNVDVKTMTNLNDPKMDWWKEAKFGMFIHWGLYAVPAGQWGGQTNYSEWIMNKAKISRAEYSALAKQFNPVKFNAEEWVKLAKAAGQRYIVITTKHHEGFAMFKSFDPYNIIDATPFKRDVVKELADACRKYDMKLGFYYSQAQDWYHPGGSIWEGKEWDETHKRDMNSYVDSLVIPQVKELMENYGDVAVLWWDTPVGISPEMAQKITAVLKKYPHLITNNRLGGGVGGDMETPEQHIPATGFPGRNWETCMTMNGNWGYNAYDNNWTSTTELIHKLIEIASKGGNLLLNVGPNKYGEIPGVCQTSLKEVGNWLKINGEAIYGANESPFPFVSWGRATSKGQTIYLHIIDWPKNQQLIVPLGNKITKAWLLESPKTALKVRAEKGKSVILLPDYAPDKIASVVAIQIEGKPEVLPIPSAGKNVTASSSGKEVKLFTLTDGSPKTSWGAAKGATKATFEIDLGASTSIQCLSLAEPWSSWRKNSQKYELQYQQGADWKTIVSGQTPGSGMMKMFPVVTAQKFRLLLENIKVEPALCELILYRAE